jgi:hypothetical protein
MEIFARWKKQSHAVPTILKFVDVLQQEVKLALGASNVFKSGVRSLGIQRSASRAGTSGNIDAGRRRKKMRTSDWLRNARGEFFVIA